MFHGGATETRTKTKHFTSLNYTELINTALSKNLLRISCLTGDQKLCEFPLCLLLLNNRHVQLLFTGIENIIGGVLEVMKESTSIGSFKEDIEKLATDVASGLAIPSEQKDQVTSEIRQDIKETGTSSVNSKYQLYGFIIA